MEAPAGASLPPDDWGAVILAGGFARRLGGVDKPLILVAGQTLLARAVASVLEAREVVVVGPTRTVELPREVRWTREEPPGSGPLAAVVEGARVMTRDLDVVVALACDHPWHGDAPRRLARALLDAPAEVDAVVGVTPDERIQPLLAAYRRSVLIQAGPSVNGSVRDLLTTLTVQRVAIDASEGFDVDTAADASLVGRSLVGGAIVGGSAGLRPPRP